VYVFVCVGGRKGGCAARHAGESVLDEDAQGCFGEGEVCS